MVRVGTPIALAAYCAVLCERSGIINIGIEGQMLMAAMIAYGVNVYLWNSLKAGGMDPSAAGNLSRWVALLLATSGSALLGMLHAVTSIRFRADQIISGTVLNILALGLTGYLYRQFLAQNVPAGPGTFPALRFAASCRRSRVLGPIFFGGPETDRVHDVGFDVRCISSCSTPSGACAHGRWANTRRRRTRSE